MPLVWASIHCKQEMKNKIYKLGKVDDRITVIQLTRPRRIKQKEADIWIEEDDFKAGSRLDWKIVEAF